MRIVIWTFVVLALVGGLMAWVVFYPPARDRALVGLSHLMAPAYGQPVEEARFGPLDRHRLDVYPAAEDVARQKPIILFYYGGGWRAGEKPFYHFVGAALAARGYDVVIPDYRLFPDVQFAGFMNDAALAYEWVWQNMAQENGREVVVMGHSAGAHMAALITYDAQYRPDHAPAPLALVGLAGPYSFNPKEWPSTAEIFADVSDADHARPVHFVDEKSPPSLLFHGDRDDVVKLWNQEELSKALGAQNVPHETVVLPDTGHYKILFAFARPLLEQMGVVRRVDEFISRLD